MFLYRRTVLGVTLSMAAILGPGVPGCSMPPRGTFLLLTEVLLAPGPVFDAAGESAIKAEGELAAGIFVVCLLWKAVPPRFWRAALGFYVWACALFELEGMEDLV